MQPWGLACEAVLKKAKETATQQPFNAAQTPWYFTFGCGFNLRNNFIVVLADSYSAARAVINEHYGNQFCGQYTEAEFLPQIDKYGLTEVQLGINLIKES
jgi:hypothetical protein